MNEEELRKIINYKLPIDLANGLVEDVNAKEVKDTFLAINNNKAPNLDGFKMYFFKVA